MTRLHRVLIRFWLNSQAYVALLLGAKSVATRLFERMVELDPSDPVALASLGNLRMEAGDSLGAVSAFVDLVEHHPSHADGWFNLGFIYEQREDLPAAERCFREALRFDAKLDRAWYGLALVLIRTDRLIEAIDALKTNIKLQPMSPFGFYQLGMTYHHVGRAADAQKVIDDLRKFEPKYAAGLARDISQTPPRYGQVEGEHPGPRGAAANGVTTPEEQHVPGTHSLKEVAG